MTGGTVAIIGGGKMGEALLAGLLRGARMPDQVVVSEHDADRAAHLTEKYGVRTVGVAEAAADAATVIVATKPHHVAAVLRELNPSGGTLVVSVAAGITTTTLEAGLPTRVPVVRAMPNTPALIGEGITAVAAGSAATDAHLEQAEQLLEAVGVVVRVPEEQLDAVTAVSGSGPAYVFLFVEALVDAGVQQGLPRPLATQLAVQTAAGAAAMLRDTGEHPAVLRDDVTSPGGTTAAGLRQLEAHGLRESLFAAVAAATERSRELGSGG